MIVAFGDVAGFNPWIRRGMNSPEVIHPFIEAFYAEIQSFLMRNPEIHLKYLGDGVMILKELKPTCARGVCATRFLRDTIALCRRLNRIVRGCELPPEGWRMRWTYGHVSRIEVLDPHDRSRKRKIWEFIGYAVNLAQKLLEVWPSTMMLFHQSILNIPGIGAEAAKLRLKPARVHELESIQKPPRGVDPEDLADVRVLRS